MRHRTRTSRPVATSRRVRRMAIAASLLALLGGVTAAPAQAATHENVLRGWCHLYSGDHRTLTRECMLDADDDTGRIGFRDRAGRDHIFHSGARFLASVRHHAPACVEEDSPRCWWDASEAGNGVGESFAIVGGHHSGQGLLLRLNLY